MTELFDFVGSLWEVITAALRFSDDLLAVVESKAQSRAVILIIMFLAGLSFLIGQSTILFINQVSPFWFVISIVVNAVLFSFHFALWSVAIWLLNAWAFGTQQAFGSLARMVGLGSTPFIFGWLILLPYFGPFVE